MFRFIDTPSKLRQIDKLIGRKPAQPGLDSGYVPVLLKKGLHLTYVSGRDNERALGPDGLKYMRDYYTSLGDYDTVNALTPRGYEEWRAGMQQLAAQDRRFPGQSSRIVEPPTVDHIFRLLKTMPAVIVTLSYNKRYTHLAIAYGTTKSGRVKLYEPHLSEPTLVKYSPRELSKLLSIGEHMTGVS